MSSTLHSIHKKLEREKYEATSVGQAEKRLRKIFDYITLKDIKLSDTQKSYIESLRTQNEKDIMESEAKHKDILKDIKDKYDEAIKDSVKDIDKLLSDTMNKEADYLEENLKITYE